LDSKPDKYHRLNIAELHDLAAKKNGKLISSAYVNNKSKLEWQCQFGHRWLAITANIKKGKWCPECSGNKKLTIVSAIELSKTRGGYCLSNNYINSGYNLLWKCKYGHEFKASLNNIRSKNSWCPYCSLWSSEEICRIYFETIFNDKFERIRPKWLKNDRGNNLELDGYCANLKIAFEHNGIHHYKDDGHAIFYANGCSDVKLHDEIKKQICNQQGIRLIIVPQLFLLTKIEDLKDLIKNQCIDMNIKLPDDFDHININFFSTFVTLKLEKYISLVNSIGGEYVSGTYFNLESKITWKCNNEHIFKMSCSAIKYGHWCAKCRNNKKIIQRHINIARQIS